MRVRPVAASGVEPASAAPSHTLRDRVVCGAAVFLASLCLYVWTLAPTVTLVDSGELITAARTLGVAHPPGFPLYILLAHLATLAPTGTVAQRVNFASALFAASASAVVSLAVLEAIATVGAGFTRVPARATQVSRAEAQDRRRSGRARETAFGSAVAPTGSSAILPGVTAGLLFACSRTFWSYATIAEVYTLNAMLIALTTLCMLRWQRLILDDRREASGGATTARDRDRYLKFAALFFGLGLGVHHVTVGLVLPACAVLVLATEGWRFLWSKRLAIAAMVASVGLSVYLYLPIAASRSPLINWGDPRTLERFLSHVTAWQYRVFLQTVPERIGRQLAEVRVLTLREFGPMWLPVALVLAIAGLVCLWRRSRGLWWFLVTAAVANLAYNVNYEIAEDKDAYYLPMFLVIAVAAGVGAWYGADVIPEKSGGAPALRLILAAGLLVSVPAIALVSNLPFNNRRHYFIARDYVENLFSTVEPGGMVLTLDWQVYSPSLYMREVEGFRRDAVVIDVNHLRRSWYFDYLETAYPETMNRVRGPMSAFLRDLRRWERDPDLFQRDAGPGRRISERFEELILTLITDHLRRATVYVTLDIGAYRGGRDAGWAQQIARKYQLVPQGLVFQLFDDRAFHTTARASLVVRGIADRSLRFEDDDVVKVKVLPVYSGMLYNRGLYFARAGRHDEAIEAFKEALAIEPRFSVAERRMAESLAIVGQRR